MGPHVSLQLICISAGITAQTALERTLSCVGANVALQLANLYTGVVTHRALERFLMSVLVASVSHQLSTGDKGHVTVSALMWSGACVGIKMVPQQSHSPKCSSAKMALVRPLVCVALHVAVQIGPAWASVTAQLTLECLLNTCTKQMI